MTTIRSTLRSRRAIALIAAFAAALLAALSISVLNPPQSNAFQAGTWYTLQSRHSGLNLQIEGSSSSGGAQLVQNAASTATSQQFRFIDVGSGYYKIQVRHSNLVLDIWEWNANDGATIAQYTDLGGTNQQWRITESSDGYLTFVNRFSGKALDVWEWSTSSGSRISQYTATGEWNQQWRATAPGGGGDPAPQGLQGWATQNGGTTGGAGGSSTTVSSASAFTSAVSGGSAKTVRVSGTISLSGMVNVGSNTTIIGNSGARITGGGLQFDSVHNVIVQNMTFDDWDDDAVNVQDESTNLWFDNNTFGTGYDGALDIKRGSDFITVSWNKFNGTDKTMLLGHSDGNGGQDIGHLRVSYHHNWFNGTNQRTPRVRFGETVHVYSNYYVNIGSYCVATTENAGVLFEGNYLENADDAVHIGEGSSDDGRIVSRNNHLVNTSTPQSNGSVGGVPYSYSLDTPSQVKSIVTGAAGAN
ncbi:RICIN domain-containing protein [Glycomyces sp. A-F 0318]|uniref:pectate lyase family protein n=1 Tax=Glycomyces amatae TaxID=2881355 RepID=UPI001E368950|nr:RICIN domain-containing protein [Glycomyces amatae]MCD0445248.1 RICIN domain-containing protein [Glycomyces amatae]